MSAASISSPAPLPASTPVSAAVPMPLAAEATGISFPKLPLPGPGSVVPRTLPAPPRPGSIAEKAELAAIRLLQKGRSPERDAWAQHLAKTDGMDEFRSLLGAYEQEAGKLKGVGATALMYTAIGATAATTAYFKHKYDRQRPFQVDDRIVPVVKKPGDSSYPSGHTSAAFAAARIISNIDPSRATEAYRIATEVGMSRIYGGVHFPSDVVAGALLGTVVADRVLHVIGR